jgi:hypothetical protein
MAEGVRFRNAFGEHRDVMRALELRILGVMVFWILAILVGFCVFGALMPPHGTLPN